MINEESIMVENEQSLAITKVPEIIKQLKAVKEAQNLSIDTIKEKIEAHGYSPAKTTLRRVFAKDSENCGFSYATIEPLVQVLLIDYGLESDNELRRARTEAYEAVFRYKNALIDHLETKVNDLEKLCDAYESRIAFLRQQIATKDKYMNRKDAIIQTLMKKVFGEELALDDDIDDTEQP